MKIEKDQMVMFEYISKTREYLDYLEEHITNVFTAYNVVIDKCSNLECIKNQEFMEQLRNEVLYHDISKMSSEELVPYRANFYGTELELFNEGIDFAWENHK